MCNLCCISYAFLFVIYYFRHACIKSTEGKSRRRCWRTLDKSLWNSSDSGYFSKSFSSGWRLSYRANILCGWLSPLNHATFPMHNFGYDYLPQIKISILLFLAVICILLFISRKCIKRYNFTFSQVDES